jgi:predicted secreted protein
MASLPRSLPARLAALLVCTALACQAGAQRGKPPMLTALIEDNGRSLTLHPGQALRIVLHENATSGYRWELEHVDADVIELAAEQGDYANPAVGAGGNAEFLFRSKRPGSGKIVLKHWRSWEGEASTVGRFCLDIKVEAGQ